MGATRSDRDDTAYPQTSDCKDTCNIDVCYLGSNACDQPAWWDSGHAVWCCTSLVNRQWYSMSSCCVGHLAYSDTTVVNSKE